MKMTICTFWIRQEARDVSDAVGTYGGIYGYSAAFLATRAERYEREDKLDPPCGECPACKDAGQALDEAQAEALYDGRNCSSCKSVCMPVGSTDGFDNSNVFAETCDHECTQCGDHANVCVESARNDVANKRTLARLSIDPRGGDKYGAEDSKTFCNGKCSSCVGETRAYCGGYANN